MATKVGFAYGNTIPTTSTSKFTDGTLYFNISNKKLYMRQGSSVRVFDGNNNSGLVNVYSKNNTISLIDAAAAYIQPAPTTYSNSYASSISNATSWYELYGQGVISSTTLVDFAYESSSDFDAALLEYGEVSRPPLNDATEIVFAVDLMNLSKAANNGTPVSGSTAFGFYPYEIIVHCYRTSASSYPVTNTSDYEVTTSTKPMFAGSVSLGPGELTYSSIGATAKFGTLQIELCPNASNAVYVSGKFFTVGTEYQNHSKNTSASFSASSAQYAYDLDETTRYPNIEKHIYPLYIRYI